jgi:hypothetical protein
LPDGQITPWAIFPVVQPVFQKYSGFQNLQISLYRFPSRLTQGALAIVTAARRDAVDAGGAFDEWR